MSSSGLLHRRTFLASSGLLAATLVIGASTVGIGLSAASADPAPPTQGLEYVALGDSYSAGYGLTPLTGLPVPGCAQSSANFPHLIAAELGLNLTDVTCSGAVTANITTTPQITPAETNPVQASALSETTDIVTITIGGNDLGFSEVISACTAASPVGPTLMTLFTPTPLANCKELFAPGGADSLAAKIESVVKPAVAGTFAAIRAQAPNAKIFVLAYPALAPDAANTPIIPSGCFSPVTDGTSFFPNAYPFTAVDVPYLNSVQSQLDLAIAAEAGAAGATYVSLFGDTLPHTPCAGVADPYTNGITFTSTSGATAPGAMHPNAAGTAFMTEQATADILAAVTAPVFTSGTPTVGTVGASYSFAVTAQGFPAPTFAVTSGALPTGLVLDPVTGMMSGTPTEPGTFIFGFTATNPAGSVDSPSYSITVRSAPVLTSGAPTAATAGVPYAFTVTASGVPAPTFQVATGALPAGLDLNAATGEITGTPTTAGSAVFSVSAMNVVGTATSPEYTVAVAPPLVAPTITSGSPPEGKVGLAYSFTITASGNPAPTFAVSSGMLPEGLALNSVTGAITGVPLNAGPARFSITASNQVGANATASYGLSIQPAAAVPKPAPKPTASSAGLANSGADLASTGALGLLALLAGAGLMLRRRGSGHSQN